MSGVDEDGEEGGRDSPAWFSYESYGGYEPTACYPVELPRDFSVNTFSRQQLAMRNRLRPLLPDPSPLSLRPQQTPASRNHQAKRRK